MYSFRTSIALLLTTLTLPAAVPQWPQFRGPNGSGVAADQKPVIHFSPNSNVLWKVSLDSGASSPCIWGDRIFLTAFADDKLQTICLNRRDGKVLWQKPVLAEKFELFHKQDGSPAASTPATDGKRVYVYFGSFGALAYDLDGKEQWKTPLPVAQTFGGFGTGTSPVLAGDVVVINRDQVFDSHVLALDRQTGKVKWKSERGQSYSWSTPIVWKNAGADEIVLPGSLQVSAYDPADGATRWIARGIAGATCSSPVIGGGLLFVSAWSPQDNSRPRPEWEAVLEKTDQNKDDALSKEEVANTELQPFFQVFDLNRDGRVTADEYKPLRDLTMKAKNALIAIRPGGHGDITDSHVAWTENKGLPYVPSPLYYDGRIYLVKDGGMASCLDAASGKTHYLQERLGVQGSYYSSPVAADGRVYVASFAGTVAVFKAGDTLEVLARNEMKERIFATSAIVENTLYVRTANNFYAIGVPRS